MHAGARFCRYELRTTDVAAARVFYAAVLGARALNIVPLPLQVAARGAPAHWLGYLGVDDAERTACAFAERGATRLGPTRAASDGGEVALLRDPGGAVVALGTSLAAPVAADVVWHVLNTQDLESVSKSYRALFGWQLTDSVELGALGAYQQFSWRPGEASVGAVVDITGRPAVHPHWLFHFRVAALDAALLAVGSGGGVVAASVALPNGQRIAVCDDPEGAAFALTERSPY
ncbi:MAG TPA: hypothetical protein VK524_33485 [Polyangiaceae bacterium]|nr:hypothetical protein [Polyangiaceae bacterium]